MRDGQGSISAEVNTTTLQRKVILRALDGALRSGATFGAEKTSFIHFTKNHRQRQLPAVSLDVDGAAVALACEVKVLGLILDQNLRFDSHVGKASGKGMMAVLTLRRLRASPPPVAQQLFRLHGCFGG